MSKIRKHNAPRVGWWLEGYGDRFGAGPQEILRIENRKLTGSMPLNKAIRDIMEDEDLSRSDEVMLSLIFVKMRGDRPGLYDALRDTYLSVGFSMGDLDRTGRAAEPGGPEEDSEAFDLVMRVYGARVWLLGELEKIDEPGRAPGRDNGHYLEVGPADRARSKREAKAQDETRTAEDRYGDLASDYARVRRLEGAGERAAQGRVASIHGVTDRTVRNALRWARDNRPELLADPSVGDRP